MKINFIKIQQFIMAGFLFMSCDAFSADKTITIEGTLRINITDSAIDTQNDSYEFMTNSPISEMLLKKCEGWELCKATVLVDEHNTIKSVISAEKVDVTNKNTKTISTEGVISVGTLDSSIGDAIFLTNSDIGNKIFKKCGNGYECKVTAIVDNDNLIKSLVSVEKVGSNELKIISTNNKINNKSKPSFDCLKASTFVEKSICSDYRLSNMDNDLMDIYKRAYSSSKDQVSLKNEQKNWIINVRNKCQDNKCIADAYNSRFSILDNSISDENNLLPYGPVLNHGKNPAEICIRDARKAQPTWYRAQFHADKKTKGRVVIVSKTFMGIESDKDVHDEYEGQCHSTELRENRWERDSFANPGAYSVFIFNKGITEKTSGIINDNEGWITIK